MKKDKEILSNIKLLIDRAIIANVYNLNINVLIE